MKCMLKKGDIINYQQKSDGRWITGKVVKVYETTFGSKIKDTAVQIELSEKFLGRSKTTLRARNYVSILP